MQEGSTAPSAERDKGGERERAPCELRDLEL